MIVEPYKRNPAPPRVAVLTEEGAIVDEDGGWLDPDEVPAGTRVFAQWDVVRELMAADIGEALCWNNEEIRWRFTPRPAEEEWRSRPGDAYVLRLPLTDILTPKVMLGALVSWRDWLGGCGAAPTGTTGSSSMSLLRSRLERRLVCGFGSRPPLIQTRGGRLQLGVQGQGRVEGRLALLDLPSAYATLLGSAVYGGAWREVDRSGRLLDHWLEREEPMFVQAEVSVPSGLPFGPLVRTFRRRIHFAEMQVYSKAVYPDGTSYLYPTGRRLAGVWTREEFLEAVECGCRVKVRGAWVHRAAGRPLFPWWQTVSEGRDRLSGVGSTLAKMTGNALWGRFCMDPRVAGRRTIRGGRAIRQLEPRPAPPPAHDLAEYVSGTVRARLFRLMRESGDRLVSANTDGAWILDDGTPPPDGWRVKSRAHRLELLAPACLRYWPEKSRWPRVVYAGQPFRRAEVEFENAWQRWIAQTS